MAVNLSAQQLRSPDLIGEVRATLRRHGLGRGDLELEVTESTAMEDPERAIGQLKALRDLGVDLAIDDFGTGYSSLAYLKLLPIQTLKVGSLGTHKALGLAKAKGARFLITSTSEIYGDPLVHPQTESYWGNVNTIGPRGCYDESKRFAEALVMAYHREHQVATRIVRIFNTYGPRMRIRDGRVVPAFIGQALANEPITIFGDGTQTRSFCYCSDLIEGIYRLMMAEGADAHLPTNIGNPHELNMLQFAEAIIRATGSRSKIVHRPLPQDDPKQRRPDISRARALLKWQPKVSLEEGLKDTIYYFRSRLEIIPGARKARVTAVSRRR